MELHVAFSLYFVASLLRVGELLHLSPVAEFYSDCQGCVKFPPNGSSYILNDVRRLLIDKKHNKLIIGARNVLFRLDLSLRLTNQDDMADLTPSVDVLNACKLQANKEDCHNFIRLLLFNTQGDIFVCGTYAEKRHCWTFNRTGDLHPSVYVGETLLWTPRSKNQNVTGVFAGDFIFTGLNVREQPGFYRSNMQGPQDIVQTLKEDVFLKDANFVSSFLGSDNFIYIFLRETAVENQAKVVYSRVARVCLYDAGVPSILTQRFSSFTKIRLSCSIPGDIPFNYDELQATYLSVDSQGSDSYVYGIFSTPELGVLGSAVCAYRFKRIQELFESSKYLEKTTVKQVSVWGPAQRDSKDADAGRPKCDPHLKTKNYSSKTARFAKEHALLSGIAEPEARRPLFVKADSRFTQLVADKVAVSGGQAVHVMFIGTDNGTVYKVFSVMTQSGRTPFVVEQIQVFKSTSEPIYSMELYKGFLYIGSLSHVVRVPVQRCHQYKSCRTCISSRDPYCGWSKNKCVTKTTAGNSVWRQNIIDGHFASICPEESATCSLTITQSRPGGTSMLLCQAEGIPVPTISSWKRNSRSILGSGSFSTKSGPHPGSQLLVISRFGVEHLGLYQCSVSNKLGTSSCTLNFTGASPIISSRLVKINFTSYFSCRAEGIPKARVVIYQVTGNEKKAINADKTPLRQMQGDRSYYCIAENAFGLEIGKILTVQDRDVVAELKLLETSWHSDLLDTNSERYETLAATIKTAVQQTYSTNPAFVGLNKITFREGSVISKMSLSFAAQKSDSHVTLLQELQKAVSSGHVGGLNVDRNHVLDVNPKPTEGTQEPRMGGRMDTGLFAAGIITAILFSILVGFCLGVKFHSQATGHCRRKPDSPDGPDDNTVKGVSFVRSPSRNDGDRQGRQSQRKLVNHTSNGTEPSVDEDDDSDLSMGGSISPTIKPPQRRAPLANGEVFNM